MENEIKKYVLDLKYDAKDLLKMPGENFAIKTRSKEDLKDGTFVITTKEKITLKPGEENLDDIAIFNTNNVIYPGNIVLVNEDLVNGFPTKSSIKFSKLKLRVDLPGLGSNGTIKFEENQEIDSSEIQSKINDALNSWHENEFKKGYTVNSRQEIKISSVSNFRELATTFKFNAKGANASLENLLNIKNSKEALTVVAMYKQIFYSVSVEADLDGLKGEFSLIKREIEDGSKINPPGYISRVDYGRIFFLKMETDVTKCNVEDSAKLEGIINKINLSGELTVNESKILKNSTFSFVSLGGSAQAGADIIASEDMLKALKDNIKKYCEYSKNNQGFPVSYVVNFLNNGKQAIVKSNSEYIKTVHKVYKKREIKLIHHGAYVATFIVKYKKDFYNEKGEVIKTEDKTYSTGNETARITIQVPDLDAACHSFNVEAGEKDALVWHKWNGKKSWRKIFSADLLEMPVTEIKISGTTCGPSYSITYSEK